MIRVTKNSNVCHNHKGEILKKVILEMMGLIRLDNHKLIFTLLLMIMIMRVTLMAMVMIMILKTITLIPMTIKVTM